MRPHILTRAVDCGPARAATGGLLVQSCAAMMGDSGAPIVVETTEGPRVVAVLSGMAQAGGRSLSVAVPLAGLASALAELTERL
jgi:V8-like Glu-specific endopeptidase